MSLATSVEMSTTMRALQAGLTVEGITLYLFWLGTVGMAAGALYLFMMQSTLAVGYRKVAIVAGIICSVAAFHYYRMSGIYLEALANAITVDAAGNVQIGELMAFPTAYRYIDWLITVPLLVLEFPLLLGLGKKVRSLFWGLGLLSIVMLITAWIAEVSPVGGASWWGFFIVSCIAWLAIVVMLYTSVSKASEHLPSQVNALLGTMKLYILIGWAIYPIGFLLVLAGNESLREIAYNIADVINKVGFGVVSVVAAGLLSKLGIKAADEPLGEQRLTNAS